MAEILQPGTVINGHTIVEHVNKDLYTVRCACGRLTRKHSRGLTRTNGCTKCKAPNHKNFRESCPEPDCKPVVLR